MIEIKTVGEDIKADIEIVGNIYDNPELIGDGDDDEEP